jgi:thiol-disulfide isomerase/thioredoxin
MKAYFTFLIILMSVCLSNLIGQNNDMIIGHFEREVLETSPYDVWYHDEYNAYRPDSSVMMKMNGLEGIEIMVILGTWCSDSRREVPRFIKLMDDLDVNPGTYQLIGLDRQKTSPDFDAKTWNIEFVPTFIFLKDGNEIGRIIETPELSLEEDLFNIIK